MAVKKKKEPSVQDFIDKGADVKASKVKKSHQVLLNIPMEMLDELDAAVAKKSWGKRTEWILEAIYQRLRSF
jgi:hypothetical protein